MSLSVLLSGLQTSEVSEEENKDAASLILKEVEEEIKRVQLWERQTTGKDLDTKAEIRTRFKLLQERLVAREQKLLDTLSDFVQGKKLVFEEYSNQLSEFQTHLRQAATSSSSSSSSFFPLSLLGSPAAAAVKIREKWKEVTEKWREKKKELQDCATFYMPPSAHISIDNLGDLMEMDVDPAYFKIKYEAHARCDDTSTWPVPFPFATIDIFDRMGRRGSAYLTDFRVRVLAQQGQKPLADGQVQFSKGHGFRVTWNQDQTDLPLWGEIKGEEKVKAGEGLEKTKQEKARNELQYSCPLYEEWSVHIEFKGKAVAGSPISVSPSALRLKPLRSVKLQSTTGDRKIVSVGMAKDLVFFATSMRVTVYPLAQDSEILGDAIRSWETPLLSTSHGTPMAVADTGDSVCVLTHLHTLIGYNGKGERMWNFELGAESWIYAGTTYFCSFCLSKDFFYLWDRPPNSWQQILSIYRNAPCKGSFSPSLSPLRLSSQEMNGEVRLAAEGNLLYLSQDSELSLFRVSEETKPQAIWKIYLSATPRLIFPFKRCVYFTLNSQIWGLQGKQSGGKIGLIPGLMAAANGRLCVWNSLTAQLELYE